MRYSLCMCAVWCLLSLASAQETFPLQWRFEKGMANVNRQFMQTQTTRTVLQKDMKPSKRAPDVTTVSTKCVLLWEVPEITSKNEAVVTIYSRGGIIEVKKGSVTNTCEVDKPEDAKKLEEAIFKPYVPAVKESIAFLINLTTTKVSATWQLKEKGKKPGDKPGTSKVEYERETMKLPDPYNMESAFKQLPNKVVPVGHEWKLERSYMVTSFSYNYKFVKAEVYQGWKVARIAVTGEIKKSGKKIGDIQGHILFAYEHGVMIENQTTETMEETFPATATQKEIGGTVVKTVRNVHTNLMKTNVKPRK